MRRVRTAWLSLVIVTLLASTLPGNTTASAALAVKLGKKAVLLEGGLTVEITAKVTCAPGQGRLQESLVYVVQDDFTSQFSHLPVVCDGQPHKQVVRVRAQDKLFDSGMARASAYILLYDETTGRTLTAGDSRVIKIK